MYEYKARLIKVVDGDTIDIEIDLGLHIFHEVRCRLFGLNAPERYTPAGPAATEWLTVQLVQHPTFMIRTYKDKTEKYGRYLVSIYTDSTGISVNQRMINAGHAVAYMDKI
jgi:micrococcal nuclease